ncbi:MAG: hypothetical protein QM758_00305 [Armatimonas sp.]
MSTVTVVVRDGYAAIASDTLTTGGIRDSAAYVVNHHKILPLGENYIGVTGTTTGKLMLADYFSTLRSPRSSIVRWLFSDSGPSCTKRLKTTIT